MPYPSYRFDDAKLLETGNLITPTLPCITFGCNFTDIINISSRLGSDFSTMICLAPIGFHSVTYCIKKYRAVMYAGPNPEGGGHTQCFLNYVLMKNA